MKTCKHFFVLLIILSSLQMQAQWNKLPAQNLINYWPWVPWSPWVSTKIFPAFIRPVSNGHILIAAYYDNGSVSANSSYYNVFESFDDLASHRNLTMNPYRNFGYPPVDGIPSLVYARGDSAFSWVQVGTTSLKNKYTENDFQTMDSVDNCLINGPNNLVTNCLTKHFLYSVLQNGYLTSTDSLSISRSDLTSANVHCKRMRKYDGSHGVIKPVNDSIVLFSCHDRTKLTKKILLKTTDFGQNWNEVYLDSVNSFLDYQFTSNDTGYVLLSNNTLVKTVDSGNNWTALTTPSSTLTCFSFFDNNHGYIGGSLGFLSQTNDGGQTWNNEASGTGYQLKELFTLQNNIAYFRDSISSIYKNTALMGVDTTTTSDTTGIKNHVATQGIFIFPNPTCDVVTVQSVSGDLGLMTLYNLFGEVILQTTIKDFKTSLDFSSFASGIYLLMIKGGYIKIIKE